MPKKTYSARIIAEINNFKEARKKLSTLSKKNYKPTYFPNSGVEFEYLIIRLFELSSMKVSYSSVRFATVPCPYCNKKRKQIVEQIDGVVYLGLAEQVY